MKTFLRYASNLMSLGIVEINPFSYPACEFQRKSSTKRNILADRQRRKSVLFVEIYTDLFVFVKVCASSRMNKKNNIGFYRQLVSITQGI